MTLRYAMQKIKSYLNCQGRYEWIGDNMTMDHCCNQITFRARCRGEIVLTLSCTLGTLKSSEFRSLYFRVCVDGVWQPQRLMIEGCENQTAFCRLVLATVADGEHSITVIRCNELSLGRVTLHQLQLEGTLLPPVIQKRKNIEIFGDSYVAGYGNLVGRNAPAAQAGVNSDSMQSFAYRTVSALDVDYSIVGYSGLAFASGMGSATEFFFENTAYWRADTKPYAFSRTADMVITDLGANDAEQAKRNGADYALLTQRALDLLCCMRKHHPSATLVWAYGIYSCPWMAELLEQAVALFAKQDGNAVFHALPIVERRGGDWHPTAEEHAVIADELTAFVKPLLFGDSFCQSR